MTNNNAIDVQLELHKLSKEPDLMPSEQAQLHYFDFLNQRGVEYICPDCAGLGVKGYGSTATWRGGIGGQAMTSSVCDNCWGSGDAYRHWPSWRTYESLRRENENLKKQLES